MTRAIAFSETRIFTKQINENASDDELKDLQKALIVYPKSTKVSLSTGEKSTLKELTKKLKGEERI